MESDTASTLRMSTLADDVRFVLGESTEGGEGGGEVRATDLCLHFGR